VPTLNLTYDEANKCWTKSLGFWFTKKTGKRVPRHFRFTYPNTPEGQRRAADELLPLLAQWQTIKAEAKKSGNPPVWFRELKYEKIPFNELMKTDFGDPKRTLATAIGNAEIANAAANPVKTMDAWTIEQTINAFTTFTEATGVRKNTVVCLVSRLKSAFTGFDISQPMISFNPSPIVDSLVAKTGSLELRGRTALNYATVIKDLCTWYSSKVETYQLPRDFKAIFKRSRFRNSENKTEIFAEDGEEISFEIFSNQDIASILGAANDRQRLYVLLALQAAMYYVDICDLKRANVHLDKEHPFLLYKRVKEGHKEPIIQKVWLWPETAELLRKELSPEGSKFALLSDDRKPLNTFAVKHSWSKIRQQAIKLLPHRRNVRFTDFRKTGGTAVANLASVDIGELHLGHKIAGQGKHYIKIQKKRLYRPLMQWREQLKALNAF
jgi:integrase